MSSSKTVPECVFIVPYRDRPQQLAEFETHMRDVLVNVDPSTYRIWYMHQCDTRPFNRGAMKNLGIHVLRDLYPDAYRQVTLVFHDIDTVPTGPDVIPDYRTRPGVVKHFYGYTHALGGIVSICAGDFERIGGFPNYWSWGYEDNLLQSRVLRAPNLTIDRSTFYPINDAVHIRQDRGGRTRTVNRGDFDRYMRMDTEGIHTIRHVVYAAPQRIGQGQGDEFPQPTSLGQGDKFPQQLTPKRCLGERIDVTAFDTGRECNVVLNRDFDAARGQAPFTVGRSARMRSRMNLVM
jgi:hypothetical protein